MAGKRKDNPKNIFVTRGVDEGLYLIFPSLYNYIYFVIIVSFLTDEALAKASIISSRGNNKSHSAIRIARGTHARVSPRTLARENSKN